MRILTSIVMCTGLVISASGIAMADDGKDTYKLVCSSCHETGIDGAPILEDKATWSHRINQGTGTLYASTQNGKCKLFVQDLRKDLSDEVIKAAIDYMVFQVRQPSPFQN